MPKHKIPAFFLVFTLLFPFIARAASPDELRKAVALNEGAIAKMKTGNLDGAEIDLLQAIEYGGENPKLKKNLGIVYYEKGVRATKDGNFYDGEKYLKSALDITPDDVRYSRAMAAAVSLEAAARAENGQSDEALALYRKAAEWDPQNVSVWAQACDYAWKTQKLDAAQEFLAKAKAIDPQDKNVKILEEKLAGSSIEENFGRQTSEHFILSAEAGAAAGKDSAQILAGLEEVYADVSYKLNFFPRNKISVVFYPAGEFHEHWKLPYRVNGYYDGKLRIPFAGKNMSFESMKPMIRHELTHAFVSAMARKPIPQWMNEGLAQWVEGRELDPKSKDALVMYQITHRVPDIAHLDSVFLTQRNPFNDTAMTLAYMKSLSLVQYLIEEHGVWSLVQFTQNNAGSEDVFRQYFEASPQEIDERWLRWIERKKSNFAFNEKE